MVKNEISFSFYLKFLNCNSIVLEQAFGLIFEQVQIPDLLLGAASCSFQEPGGQAAGSLLHQGHFDSEKNAHFCVVMVFLQDE